MPLLVELIKRLNVSHKFYVLIIKCLNIHMMLHSTSFVSIIYIFVFDVTFIIYMHCMLASAKSQPLSVLGVVWCEQTLDEIGPSFFVNTPKFLGSIAAISTTRSFAIFKK
jgi:hypothetical protein